MNKLTISIIIVLIIVVGAILFFQQQSHPATNNTIPEQTRPEIKPETKGNLGVYYFQSKELDATDFNITYVRLVIPWGAVEIESGKFSWDAQPIRRIEQSLAKGIRVIPVIRTVGADWAIKTPSQSCSSPPKDLGNIFSEDYGYSKSYYNFISEVAKRYKGKFPIVVIENEVTAENFWCGDMGEYLHLVATAKKAFQDVDPDVKIADSGIPSGVWGMVMAKELIEQGKEKEAFDFYSDYFSQSYIRKAGSIEELKDILERNPAKKNIMLGIHTLI